MTVPLPAVRRALALLPILALLLASPSTGTLAAQEEEPAPDALAAAERECRDLAAKSLRKAADAAWSADLKATAASLYRRLLDFDPEEPRARDRLGFKKGPGGWTAADEPVRKDRADARRAESLEGQRARDFREVGAAFARLAPVLRDAGREDGAREAFREALRFDPLNVEAHEGLGDRRIGGTWRTAAQASHIEFRAMVEAAAKGARESPFPVVAEARETPVEKSMGWSFRRARSRRYLVAVDPGCSDEVSLCRDAEIAEEFLGRIFGPADGQREEMVHSFLLVKDAAEFRRSILALEAGSPAELEWRARCGGHYFSSGTYMFYWRGYTTRKDHVAHKVGESFLSGRFGSTAQPRPWLHEAFGTLASGETAGTTITWCVTREASAVQRVSFDDYRIWPASLRSLVEAGEDRALGAIAASELNSLTPADVAKAVSVLLWLLETRREALPRFLDLVNTGSKENDAAEKAFGEELAVLDGRWRKWILEVL